MAGDRKGRPQALAAALPAATRAAMRRYGFAEAGIVTDWAAIVGPVLAGQSQPTRLSFPRGKRNEGTLHIAVSGPVALEMQHMEPAVVERINGFFGYRAVARLKLMQSAPPARRAAERSPPPPAAEPPPGTVEALETIEDPDLRASLLRLGRAVAGRDV